MAKESSLLRSALALSDNELPTPQALIQEPIFISATPTQIKGLDSYFCRTVNPILVRIPREPAACSEEFLTPGSRRKGKATIYGKATEPIPMSKAYICAIKKEVVSYYSDLWGNPFATPVINVSAIPAEECRSYVTSLRCHKGQLTAQGHNLYITNVPLEPPIKFPGAVKGFFVGSQKAESENCLLEETPLFYHTHDLSLYSPSHEVAHCHYNDLSCTIWNEHGNMTLIWIGMNLRPCDYKATMELTGTFSARSFLSDDHNTLLIFNESQQLDRKDCLGTPIIISNQGYAIKQSEFFINVPSPQNLRSRREVATTEELAAELSAEEYKTHEKFLNLLRLVCPLISNSHPDPTLKARRAMKRENVMGKWRTDSILEVYQCTVVYSSQIKLRPLTNCTLFLPVTATLPKIGEYESFRDPRSKILSQTSPLADCRIHNLHYADSEDGLLEFDVLNNITRIYPENKIAHISPFQTVDVFEAEDFHDLVLTRDVEVFQEAFNSENIQELERVHQWIDKVDLQADKNAEAIGAKKHSISSIVDSIMMGEFALVHEVWINGVCIIVTIGLIYLIIRCAVKSAKSAVCAPIRQIFKAIGFVFCLLCSIIYYLAWGVYIVFRALFRVCIRSCRSTPQPIEVEAIPFGTEPIDVSATPSVPPRPILSMPKRSKKSRNPNHPVHISPSIIKFLKPKAKTEEPKVIINLNPQARTRQQIRPIVEETLLGGTSQRDPIPSTSYHPYDQPRPGPSGIGAAPTENVYDCVETIGLPHSIRRNDLLKNLDAINAIKRRTTSLSPDRHQSPLL